MEIRVTTRDDVMYVVDSGDQADALGAFFDASDEEWVRVVPAATRTNRLFLRRSAIKLVAVVEDEAADEGAASAALAEPDARDQII